MGRKKLRNHSLEQLHNRSLELHMSRNRSPWLGDRRFVHWRLEEPSKELQTRSTEWT